MWQSAIAWTFIVLSGWCYKLSKHKLKNGIKVFVAGAIVSLVTYIFMSENLVMYGVLTMLGSCMIILVPLEKYIDKCPAIVGILVNIALFISTYDVAEGYITIVGMKLSMPEQVRR